jgi:signal transduction histidine kinase
MAKDSWIAVGCEGSANKLGIGVIRHADAHRVRIVLTCEPGRIELDIADDGRGPDPEAESAGHGITGMAERVESHGGTLQAGPGPQGGFHIRAAIPYARSAESGATR